MQHQADVEKQNTSLKYHLVFFHWITNSTFREEKKFELAKLFTVLYVSTSYSTMIFSNKKNIL